MSNFILYFLLCLSFNGFAQSPFYNFQIPSIKGTAINFKDFQGKKILIVNVASTGSRSSQLDQLEQLQAQYRDRGLVIIAFPTNDFKNEPRNGTDLENFYSSGKYSFLIASKASVKGSSISPLYNWINSQLGGSGVVKGDFQKFLIKEGKLVGIYSGRLTPLDKHFLETF